jgi:Flp pilus assembly protein TadD
MKVSTDSPVARLHAQALRCLKSGKKNEGIVLLRQAIELYPSSGDLHAELASALGQNGELEQAAEHYKKAARLSPKQPFIHYACGLFLLETGNAGEAERYFRKTFALQPESTDALAHIGTCLQRQKKFGEAEKIFAEAAARDPLNIEALYGLGQIYDARGDTAQAFTRFRQANEVQSRDPIAKAVSLRAFPGLIGKFRDVIASGEASSWTAPPMPDNAPRLVFLVGFPRSGTTLLDQILSGHPDIEVAEERLGLAAAGNHIITTKKKSVPGALSSLSDDEIQKLRNIYFSALKGMGFSLRPGSVFIDKLPLNLVYAPFIHRLFPEAKFILALRHPCDSVLSCYMQLFVINEAMIHFLDLERAARFYDQAFAAWDGAQTALKLKTHIVRYENVVQDLRGEVEAALAFLGLDWHEGMEKFDETARSRRIKTPSSGQVTQKIYTGARGRWHKYRDYMGDVPDILRPWIEKFGYEIDE